MEESVFGELMPRLSRYHGWMRLTLTPTPESPNMQYLRDEIAKGKEWYKEKGVWNPAHWQELVTEVDLNALTPRGGLIEVPWKTQEELDELIASYLDIERDMRVRGAWDPLSIDRLLTAFSPENVIQDRTIGGGTWYTCVGVDHGAKAGRQAAMLVACNEDASEIRYLDEAVSDGRTSPKDDAKAIIDMLKRHGWTWTDVDYWVGDRSHGGDRFGNAKSNHDLTLAFAELLNKPEHQLRGKGLDLIVPRKERGSIYRGLRIMNGMFKERSAFVHSRCTNLIESIQSWSGAKDDPKKDRLDAARYATERLLEERRSPGTSTGYLGGL